MSYTPLKRDIRDDAVVIRDRLFCFTGVASRVRRRMMELVTAHGGRVTDDVYRGVRYLVIGARAGSDWSSGKLYRAEGLRSKGDPIRIIRERDLMRAIRETAPQDGAGTVDVIDVAVATLQEDSFLCGVQFRMGTPADALAIAHAAWDEGDDAEDAGDSVRAEAAWAICREADDVVQGEVSRGVRL